MVRAAIARRWIAVAGQDDLDSHSGGARHRRVEIINLKPQEHAVPVRLESWVADWAMMMLDMPIVQLEDQLPARDQSLIIWSAVRALAAEQLLIPATARLDVAHANEWLRMHTDVVILIT